MSRIIITNSKKEPGLVGYSPKFLLRNGLEVFYYGRTLTKRGAIKKAEQIKEQYKPTDIVISEDISIGARGKLSEYPKAMAILATPFAYVPEFSWSIFTHPRVGESLKQSSRKLEKTITE